MTTAQRHTTGRGFTDGLCWVNETGEELSDVLPDANELRGSWVDSDDIPCIVFPDDGGPMYVLGREADDVVQGWHFEDGSCVILFEGCWDTGRISERPGG